MEQTLTINLWALRVKSIQIDFKYRVPFESGWTDFHPAKTIKSEK